jgi:BirA family biotin operon repressor/biotin-[acetyl-CoA-carboxylase] ligase
MSVLIKPNVVLSDINTITVATAVAVLKAIELNIGIKPSIKWVNDILYDNKKLCGILTEASVEAETGHVEYVIVGIGLNISTMKQDFPETIQDIAISLEDITEKYCDRNELIAEILNQFEKYYLELIIKNNKKNIVDIYRENLSMLGEKINVIQGNTSYTARAIDIDDNAELIIEDENGNVRVINSGEISIRRISNEN